MRTRLVGRCGWLLVWPLVQGMDVEMEDGSLNSTLVIGSVCDLS
jgi:hypothetical protein